MTTVMELLARKSCYDNVWRRIPLVSLVKVWVKFGVCLIGQFSKYQSQRITYNAPECIPELWKWRYLFSKNVHSIIIFLNLSKKLSTLLFWWVPLVIWAYNALSSFAFYFRLLAWYTYRKLSSCFSSLLLLWGSPRGLFQALISYSFCVVPGSTYYIMNLRVICMPVTVSVVFWPHIPNIQVCISNYFLNSFLSLSAPSWSKSG